MDKKQKWIPALVFGALALTAAGLMAQTAATPTQTFNAAVYFDYRYYLSNAGPVTLKPTDPTTAYLSNQFVFRRAYFTYENKISDNLKFRFRLDADNTANVTGVTVSGTTVTTKTDDKLRPFIKHLYLEWSNFLVKDLTLRVGMIETLTFKLSEERWGYRSVAKTLVDGYKDITSTDIKSSSADIGVSLGTSLSKYIRVNGMVSNGAAYSHAENDQYKKFSANVQIIPIAGFSVVGYVDYERLLPKTTYPAETKPAAETCKVDVLFDKIKGLTLGGEWFVYKNDLYQTSSYVKYDVSGWSAFGRCNLIPDKLNAFARYDSYLPNSEDTAKDMSLTILGLDWAPIHSSLKIQPNIWFYHYKDGTQYKSTATSNSDVAFNMTFFLAF